MLGKTAGGIFWMFRHLERSENTARLIDAGFRIAHGIQNFHGDARQGGQFFQPVCDFFNGGKLIHGYSRFQLLSGRR